MSTKPALSQSCNTQSCEVFCDETTGKCPSGRTCYKDSFKLSTGGAGGSGLHAISVCDVVVGTDDGEIGGDVFENTTCASILPESTQVNVSNSWKHSIALKYEFPSDYEYQYLKNGEPYIYTDSYEPSAGNANQVKGKILYCSNPSLITHPNFLPHDSCKFPCDKSLCYTALSQAQVTVKLHFKSKYSNRPKFQWWETRYFFGWKTITTITRVPAKPYCKVPFLPVNDENGQPLEGYYYQSVPAGENTTVSVTEKCNLSDSEYKNYIKTLIQTDIYNRYIKNDGVDKGYYDQIVISGTGSSLDGTYNNLRPSGYEINRRYNESTKEFLDDGTGFNGDDPVPPVPQCASLS